MKYWIRAAVVLLALGASAVGAQELFPGGKVGTIERFAQVPSGTTAGGYPMYTGGRTWYLLNTKVENNNMDVRIAYMQFISAVGDEFFAQMDTIVSLGSAAEEGYFSADLCSRSRSHLSMLNKSAGRNDNCLLVDPMVASIGGKELTLLHVKIRNSQSSWRLYDLSLYLNLDKMGFPGTTVNDWSDSAVAADPKRAQFFDKVLVWSRLLQDGVNKAIAFSKPPTAFDDVPSIQTLVVAP